MLSYLAGKSEVSHTTEFKISTQEKTMSAENTRKVIQRFMDNVESLKLLEAFGMLAEDGTWTIIGKCPASRTFNGRKELFELLLPMLGGFKQPPQIRFSPPIVEGDRAVMLGSGRGIGPTGIVYDQPHYAWVTRVRGDEIVEIIEFLDTGALETAVFGKKIVDA
jgi:ketosteroid isomerase-like protein